MVSSEAESTGWRASTAYYHTCPQLRVTEISNAAAGALALYSRVDCHDRAAVPVVTFAPPSAAAAALDDLLLHELWASLASTSAAGGQLAKFHLFEDSACDNWAESPAAFSPEQLERLHAFVRGRLFDAWRALTPELSRLSGTFELFNPAHGANMGWHQDGHAAGEYVAHYYLGTEPGVPVDEAMGWFEVALPPHDAREAAEETTSAAAVQQTDDDEPIYGVDLDGGDDLRSRVARANFVPFELLAAASQRLVVFEDAAVLHRTPLTAHARAQLQSGRQRPIARLVVYGLSRAGDTLGFAPPPTPTPPQEGGEPRPRPRPVELALPPGLCRAVEAYARATDTGESESAAVFEAALDAYVAGDADVVRFLAADALISNM